MEEAVYRRIRSLLEDDPVADVRAEAARALSAIDGDGATTVVALVGAIDDANDGVRRAATLALGRVRDPGAGDALVQILAARPELWQEASAALASAGDARLVGRLIPLLESDSSQVRRGAARAIAAVSKDRTSADEQPLFVYSDEEGHRHPLF